MAEAGAPRAIEISDLVVGFGDKAVLDHLSLDVRTGEILGLVGASGGGKSVLLRTMLGLIPKRQGRIKIFGVDQDEATVQELQKLERRWGVLTNRARCFRRSRCFKTSNSRFGNISGCRNG